MRAQKDLLDYMVEGLVDALWKLLKGLVVVVLMVPSVSRAESTLEEIKKTETEQLKRAMDKAAEIAAETRVEHRRINWQEFGEDYKIICRNSDDCASGAECMVFVVNGEKNAVGSCTCFNQLGCNGRVYYTDGTIKVLRRND